MQASNNLALTRRQRKRMQRRMNKVASTGRLEELSQEQHPLLPPVYHTIHDQPKQDQVRMGPPKARRRVFQPRSQRDVWQQQNSDSDSLSEQGHPLAISRRQDVLGASELRHPHPSCGRAHQQQVRRPQQQPPRRPHPRQGALLGLRAQRVQRDGPMATRTRLTRSL